MKNRLAIVTAGMMLTAGVAFADPPRPPAYPMSMAGAPGPQQFTMQEAVQQIFAMGVTTGQQVEARIREMQKQIDELRSYAVTCGDKPGCFTPVPSK